MDKKIKARISEIEDFLEVTDPSSQEYKMACDNLKTLYEARSKNLSLISADLIINGMFYIGGLLLVLYFEKTDIVVSKAVSFLRKN
jgi:hypothetical protein